jgi:protoporphyrinogen oxidase
VWGVPCTEIQADWGAQRIKDLSLFRALYEALKPKRFKAKENAKQVTSLIEEFNYPKYGPGQMWERCTELVTDKGTKVVFDSNVTKIEHADGRAVAVIAESSGVSNRYECTDVISSMPISALLEAMDPPVPSDVTKAAEALRYRDFMTVALVVPEEYGFPDTWIYIHDPDVEVGRIQNFSSWSPYLVKDGRTCLGLEFFVQEGDEMWTKSDADLVEQGKRELQHLNLVDASKVEDGYVVRMPKAYPFYDWEYKENVAVLRKWLEEHTPNVHPVGRNGMHRYNNQDHSMYTAMLSVENIFGADHDVWSVNVEEEYHEEYSEDSTGDGARTA